jgi:hypothetical protein
MSARPWVEGAIRAQYTPSPQTNAAPASVITADFLESLGSRLSSVRNLLTSPPRSGGGARPGSAPVSPGLYTSSYGAPPDMQ